VLEHQGKRTDTPSPSAGDSEEKPLIYPHQGVDYRKKMKELFLTDGAFLNLADFSIREFEGKNAFTLNAMVATEYPRFCNWLEEMRD